MRHRPKKTAKRRARRNHRPAVPGRRKGYGYHGDSNATRHADAHRGGGWVCPCCDNNVCDCELELSEDGKKERCNTHCNHEGFHSLKAGMAYRSKRRDRRQRTRERAQERGRLKLRGLINSPSNPVSNAQITAAARDLAAFLRANGRPLTAKNVRFAVDDSTMGLTPQQRAKYIVETCSNLGIETYEVI